MCPIALRRASVALICAAGAHFLSSGAAASQTVNYELIKLGSHGPGAINEYDAFRVDHLHQKVFDCTVTVTNTGQHGQCPLQLSGGCTLVGSATGLSGPNVRTILAGPSAGDRGENANAFWQLDQLTGTTAFCLFGKCGIFANSSKCIDVTPP
jgi:hypothetical protein